MALLPEELWRRILEIGVIETTSPPNNKILNYKDLCSLSISSKTLNRLSSEDFLWSSLLSSDFPQSSSSSSSTTTTTTTTADLSPKSIYKLWFERDKAKKILAHQRAVLRIESRIAEHSRRISEIKRLLAVETEKFNNTVSELSNLYNVRRASTALMVWQPEVVRGKQKQIVEQCGVNVDSRISALDMELKLCKQQMAGYDKAHRDENGRLLAAKEQLASVIYHPLRDYNSPSSSRDAHGLSRKRKQSKIHQTNS